MGILIDIVLAIPIGLIYNILIHKLGDIFITNCEYNEKIQKEIFFCFGGGILGALIGKYVFGSNRLDNRAVRYGFYFGTFLLMFYSVMYNWHILDNSTKFLLMLLGLIGLILISYFYFGNKKQIKKNKKKVQFQKEKVKLPEMMQDVRFRKKNLYDLVDDFNQN